LPPLQNGEPAASRFFVTSALALCKRLHSLHRRRAQPAADSRIRCRKPLPESGIAAAPHGAGGALTAFCAAVAAIDSRAAGALICRPLQPYHKSRITEATSRGHNLPRQLSLCRLPFLPRLSPLLPLTAEPPDTSRQGALTRLYSALFAWRGISAACFITVFRVTSGKAAPIYPEHKDNSRFTAP